MREWTLQPARYQGTSDVSRSQKSCWRFVGLKQQRLSSMKAWFLLQTRENLELLPRPQWPIWQLAKSKSINLILSLWWFSLVSRLTFLGNTWKTRNGWSLTPRSLRVWITTWSRMYGVVKSTTFLRVLEMDMSHQARSVKFLCTSPIIPLKIPGETSDPHERPSVHKNAS